VSIATVSRVLNGTAYVLPGTLRRVETAVEELAELESSLFPTVLLYREAPAGSTLPSVTIENERGYRAAIVSLRIEFDAELIARGDYSAKQAAESMRELFARGIEFDAVFVGDEGAAVGVLAALLAAGRRVPEDVGIAAVRLLLKRIGGEERIPSLVLPTVFVPREVENASA